MMVLVGLLGFAQAQNNSNNTRMAPPAANQTEQRGPGAPNRQPAKTALESDCYSDAEKQLIREVAEKFEQRTYTGSNGVEVKYNLFIPEGYDPTKRYPLVLFVHDAGPLSEDVKTTLLQGTGAISFASPEDQAKHPCFVLAPQYARILTDADSDQALSLFELIDQLCNDYSIDRDRLYNTGQSMGGMFALSTNIARPDMFAASYLVACQWDTKEFYKFAKKPMWIVVAEGDPKAYPGMQEGCKAWAAAGAKIAETQWDGSHLTDAYAEGVAKLRAEDANIRFVHFKLGTVKSSEFGGPAKEHMATWPVAYRIAGIRDWLFEQRRFLRADSIHAELLNPAGKEVMVVAHWGDWHGTCENSLHAIQKAVEKGAKIATLQLQKTKDGQLVCFSDPTVERVTTGKGAVKDMTLAELRQLTVREYQGPEDLQHIPTLREALDFAKGKILLAISSDAYLAEAQQIAKEAEAEELLIFTGEQAPDAGWMYIPVVDLGQQDALAKIDKALAAKPVAVELHYADDANPLLPEAYAKLKGKARVCLNTQQQGLAGSHVDQRRGDDPEVVWGTLIRQGATLIVSDQIKPFLRYLRSEQVLSQMTGKTDWVDPVTEVPEGCQYVTYPTNSRGENTLGSCLVYLPPKYAESTERYPVIYYLHGGSGNQREGRWMIRKVDAAIQTGKMKPVIIVCPQALPIGWYINANVTDPKVTSGPIEDVMIDDLIPYIDSHYRTIATREGRGIEGFSMGGRGTLMLAFKHPDLFCAASSVAGAVVNWDEEPLQRALECTFGDVNNPYSKIYFDAWHPQVFACQHARHIIQSGMKIRMFVGNRDRLYEENGRHITQRFHELLEALQIPHSFTIVPGADHNPVEIFDESVNVYDTGFWDAAFTVK